ncbi:MAG: acyl-CoA dehydrogenase family protein [Solirubrobacterales bacterium]|nr:acyl-CoA dehydrogenase family protein [Solirubrobacterales bacterium]
MDLNDTPEQAEYRAKVRTWIDANKAGAPGLDGPTAGKEEEFIAIRRDWQRVLAEGGFAGVTWPAEFGGQGLGPLDQVIVGQELQAAGVPGILDVIGIGMLGPTIIAHGTDDQKQRYLAPMLHADEVWCQLFSEPAAGSDLAGIQTKATVQEDGSWKLSGQKVWTTNAHFASFGLILARTNSDVTKHKGMSMFIVPMDAAGVDIRPLRQITGEAEFNEVFFDDVHIPADAIVGPVDGGWMVALTTLLFERLAIGGGSEGFGYRADRFAKAIADDPVASADADVRHRLGKLATDLLALRYTGYRHLTAIERGGLPGSEAALGKVTAVKAAIEAGDLIADVIGPDALAEGEWSYLISFLPGLKSAGGTEEILRNMVGERVLGLPTEPRLDKGVPFSELRALEREGAKS